MRQREETDHLSIKECFGRACIEKGAKSFVGIRQEKQKIDGSVASK